MNNVNSTENYSQPCQNSSMTQENIQLKSQTQQGVPTLEDIASYNYMNPIQQQQQKDQLKQLNQKNTWIPERKNVQNQLAPITPTTQPASITAENIQYMNGFLRTQVGRPVKVNFLIGTNTLVDKAGILLGVGVNYILLQEAETDDLLVCDFYNIKFIKFYY